MDKIRQKTSKISAKKTHKTAILADFCADFLTTFLSDFAYFWVFFDHFLSEKMLFFLPFFDDLLARVSARGQHGAMVRQ